MSTSAPSLSDPASLAALHVYSELGVNDGLIGQFSERAQLVRTWGIQPGMKVLEVGCGQGDTTIPLAIAVGESGKVVGLDPADGDYGSPRTLAQAHAFILSGPLSGRITFHQSDAPTYISSHPAEKFDIAVLAQSAWYFSSPTSLQETLSALGKVAKRVCLAEYALSSSSKEASAHVLAALTQAALEAHKPASTSNIRTVLSPTSFTALAGQAGLRLVSEDKIVPPETMYDGRWEVGAVRAEDFIKEVEANVENEREKAVIYAMRDAVIKAREEVDGKVRTMDVWVGVFECTEQ